MAPQPNTLTGNGVGNRISGTRGKRGVSGKRARGTGFRPGAGTVGNMNVPGVNTRNLTAKDAIAFHGELHALFDKYGIAW